MHIVLSSELLSVIIALRRLKLSISSWSMRWECNRNMLREAGPWNKKWNQLGEKTRCCWMRCCPSYTRLMLNAIHMCNSYVGSIARKRRVPSTKGKQDFKRRSEQARSVGVWSARCGKEEKQTKTTSMIELFWFTYVYPQFHLIKETNSGYEEEILFGASCIQLGCMLSLITCQDPRGMVACQAPRCSS